MFNIGAEYFPPRRACFSETHYICVEARSLSQIDHFHLGRGQFNHKFSLRSPPPLRPILGDMDPQWSNLPRCKKTLVNR